MPAKRIVIIEQTGTAMTAALWADVPNGRQLFFAGQGTAYASATPAEKQAISTGQVAEKVASVSRPPGAAMDEYTTELESQWQRWQDEVTNTPRWSKYGTYLDDQGVWHNLGV